MTTPGPNGDNPYQPNQPQPPYGHQGAAPRPGHTPQSGQVPQSGHAPQPGQPGPYGQYPGYPGPYMQQFGQQPGQHPGPNYQFTRQGPNGRYPHQPGQFGQPGYPGAQPQHPGAQQPQPSNPQPGTPQQSNPQHGAQPGQPSNPQPGAQQQGTAQPQQPSTLQQGAQQPSTPQPDQPGTPQPAQSSPASQPGHPTQAAASTTTAKKGFNGKLIAGLLALLAVIGLVAAVLMLIRPTTGDAGPMNWDEDYANGLFGGDGAYDENELSSCDFGDAFYESVGWINASTDGPSDFPCSGWIKTEEAEVFADMGLESAPPPSESPSYYKEERLTGWIPREDPQGGCVLQSKRAQLNRVTLRTSGTCETVHPMAIQLNNLVNYHQPKEATSEEYIDPNPAPVAMAKEDYTTHLGEAKPLGEKANVPGKKLNGATLRTNDVTLEQNGAFGKSELCVHSTFHVGTFNPDSMSLFATFSMPEMYILTPAGERIKTAPKTSLGLLPEVNERTDIDIKYCGQYTGTFRETDMLLVSTDIDEMKDSTYWTFHLGGEDGSVIN